MRALRYAKGDKIGAANGQIGKGEHLTFGNHGVEQFFDGVDLGNLAHAAL